MEALLGLPVPLRPEIFEKETGYRDVRVDQLCLAYLFPDDVKLMRVQSKLPDDGPKMFLEILHRRNEQVPLDDADNFWVNACREASSQGRAIFFYHLWVMEQVVLFAVTNSSVPVSFFRLLPTFRRTFRNMMTALDLDPESIDIYIKPSYIDLFYRFYQDFDLVYDVAPHILLVEPSYRATTVDEIKMQRRFYDFQVFSRSQIHQYSEVVYAKHEWNLDPMIQTHDYRRKPSNRFFDDYFLETTDKQCGCADRNCQGCQPSCIKCGQKTCHLICNTATRYIPKDYYLHKREFDKGRPLSFTVSTILTQQILKHEYVKTWPSLVRAAPVPGPPSRVSEPECPPEVHVEDIGNEDHQRPPVDNDVMIID